MNQHNFCSLLNPYACGLNLFRYGGIANTQFVPLFLYISTLIHIIKLGFAKNLDFFQEEVGYFKYPTQK